MLFAHVLSFACHRERDTLASMRQVAREARKAAGAEISQSRTLGRRLTDSLYELVDRQTRERYEARSPLR